MLILKKKADGNNRGTKLMGHIMKGMERVTEASLRSNLNICGNELAKDMGWVRSVGGV